MYKDKKILGVITARGGSKGIPRKNIKKLAGKPLIYYTIKAAKKSKYLTRCIVSTDNKKIFNISKKLGADVPFIRPSKLAQDKSTSLEVSQHALKWLKDNNGEEYDYLMILQPTSPLRIVKDIDKSIKKIVDTKADSVMSMVKIDDFSIKKIKKIENDKIIPWMRDEGKESARRQDLDNVYKRNCAIYLTKVLLIKKGDLFGKISRPYIMSSERSIDINSLIDFIIAKTYLKFKK